MAAPESARGPTPGPLGRVATAGSMESVTVANRGQSQISGFSVWRWPSQPGKLPLYVQRAFAVKMFGLLAFQLLLCLALMLPAHRLCQSWHFTSRGTKVDPNGPNGRSNSSVFADVMPVDQPGVLLALYYGLSFACMLMLILQWWVRDRYPWNYFCSFVSTLMVGAFFGISDELLLMQIHTRLLCIVTMTMSISSLLCCLFLREEWCKNLVLMTMGSIGIGWAVSSITVLAVSQVLDPVNYVGKTCTACLLAAFVLTFLLVHAWNSLMNSKVDDLVGIVAVMDASLLAVVSLPFLFLLLAFCAPSSAMQIQQGGVTEPSPEDVEV